MLIHVQPGDQTTARYALLEADGKIDEVSPGIFEVSAASAENLKALGLVVTRVASKKAKEAPNAGNEA